MALSMNVGEFVVGTLGLVDHDTQAAVVATFSNPNNTSSDANVATVDTDGKVVGIGAGTADITFTVDVEYTDANTKEVVKATKTVVETFTIVVPPTPQTTDLTVSFSDPQKVA